MVRALTVFFAAAWLALAPAAFAATAHKKPAHETEAKASAHKTSAKSKGKARADDGEAPSKRAKLRRAAAGDPVEEVATTAKSCPKPHGKTHGKTHGKAVKCKLEPKAETTDTEVAAAEPKTSRRHGKATEAVDEAPVHTTHHYAAIETPTIRRAEEREEGACAAARDAKGRHRRSSKARAAAYKTCVARARAAARRAAEEQAARIATWTPTKGPILYTGAAAHAVSGPTPYAALNPAADPGAPALPAAATANPAAGAAVVSVPPAASHPAGGGGFLGLFPRKPERPAGAPAPTLAGLLGADETRLRAELGDPDLMRAEGGGALWTYKLQTCAVYVFLSRPKPNAPWQVKGAQAGPLKRGQAAPDLDGCLKAGRP
jgi:hypothetical protein